MHYWYYYLSIYNKIFDSDINLSFQKKNKSLLFPGMGEKNLFDLKKSLKKYYD